LCRRGLDSAASLEAEPSGAVLRKRIETRIMITKGAAMFRARLVNRIPLLCVALSLAAATSVSLSAEEAYEKQKVVYHLNEYGPEKQTAVLRNVQNHINAVGADNIELAIVMHGDGLSLLLYPDALSETKMKEANADDQMQARIAGLKQQGVAFEVCANTLKGRDVDVDDLYDVDEADIVPSGVAEIAKLQADGYTYLRP
jgi:intracellular sulfur oxidation DsrE/DsrF family protein